MTFEYLDRFAQQIRFRKGNRYFNVVFKTWLIKGSGVFLNELSDCLIVQSRKLMVPKCIAS